MRFPRLLPTVAALLMLASSAAMAQLPSPTFSGLTVTGNSAVAGQATVGAGLGVGSPTGGTPNNGMVNALGYLINGQPFTGLTVPSSCIIGGNGTALAGVTLGSNLSCPGGVLTAAGTGAPGGTTGQVQINNGAGAFGALAVTGSGAVVLGTSPTISAPTLTGITTTAGITDSGGINTISAYQVNGIQALRLTNPGPGNGAIFMGPSSGANYPSGGQWLVGIGSGNFQFATTTIEGTAVGALACQYATGGDNTCFGTHALGYDYAGTNNNIFGNDTARNIVASSHVEAFGTGAAHGGAPNFIEAFGEISLAGNGSNMVLSGTVTAGDTFSIAMSWTANAGIPGIISGSLTSNLVTAVGGDTLYTIAAKIAAAINAVAPSIIQASTPVTSGGPAAVTFALIGTGSTGLNTVITPTVTGAATEVLTVTTGSTGASMQAIGYDTLEGNYATTMHDISAVGDHILAFGTIANQDVFVGNNVAYNGTSILQSTEVGWGAGYGATGAGNANLSLFGYKAGYGLGLNVANVTILGAQDTSFSCITTGNGNMEIGADACVASPTALWQLSIQNEIWGTGNSGLNTTMSTGQIGIAVKAPSATFSVGDAGGTSTYGAHISIQQTTAPTITTGTATVDTHASDVAGTVTEGTSQAGFVLTFSKSFGTVPHCVISGLNGAAALTYTEAPATLTVAHVSMNNAQISYICLQ